jgi:hypothetical protein
MTAASPTTDHLFVGSVVRPLTGAPMGFVVWRNDAGTGTLNAATEIFDPPDAADDKGFLAVGPPPGGGSERTYLAFTRRFMPDPCFGSDYLAWRDWQLANPPQPNLLAGDPLRIDPGNPGPACDRRGFGVAPLVIPAGANVGRLVVAYRAGGVLDFSKNVETCYTDPTSQTGWGVEDVLDETLSQEAIFGFDPGMSLPGPSQFQTFPSIAIDPNDPTIVYVAFAGSDTADGLPNNPVNQNIDLYIARSTTGGVRPNAQTPAFTQIFRITDDMLNDDDGTDQFYPAVTVDGTVESISHMSASASIRLTHRCRK